LLQNLALQHVSLEAHANNNARNSIGQGGAGDNIGSGLTEPSRLKNSENISSTLLERPPLIILPEENT
jgi:hypothetical protein